MKKEYKPVEFAIVYIWPDIIVASPMPVPTLTWQPTLSTSEIEP